MLIVDYGQCGGPLHVVNSPSCEERHLVDPASWLVTVRENVGCKYSLLFEVGAKFPRQYRWGIKRTVTGHACGSRKRRIKG